MVKTWNGKWRSWIHPQLWQTSYDLLTTMSILTLACQTPGFKTLLHTHRAPTSQHCSLKEINMVFTSACFRRMWASRANRTLRCPLGMIRVCVSGYGWPECITRSCNFNNPFWRKLGVSLWNFDFLETGWTWLGTYTYSLYSPSWKQRNSTTVAWFSLSKVKLLTTPSTEECSRFRKNRKT